MKLRGSKGRQTLGLSGGCERNLVGQRDLRGGLGKGLQGIKSAENPRVEDEDCVNFRHNPLEVILHSM